MSLTSNWVVEKVREGQAPVRSEARVAFNLRPSVQPSAQIAALNLFITTAVARPRVHLGAGAARLQPPRPLWELQGQKDTL